MSYKTILVHAGASARAGHIAACASRIAIAEQAHLVGLASTGINPLMYECNAAAAGIPLLPQDLSGLIEPARQALDQFTATASGLGVASSEVRLSDDSMIDSLVLQSRYCDLVVVGQAGHGHPADDSLPQELILHCPRPVLVIPARAASSASASGRCWPGTAAWRPAAPSPPRCRCCGRRRW